MADDTFELQASTTAWQIAMQEILRMVVRDLYQSHGEVAFTAHIKRLEEGAVDSIYSDLRLRGTNEWTETLVKEKATNIVTNLLTSFTFEQSDPRSGTA
ncbi:hypothetical protein GOA59_31990 [Sinorhizobium meliloti]|uniref:hypothetical protein n=1 Tax=Rhizobium meliloti TaxID=382 RepID=UPI0002A598E0|nr:hypothetical protein [Sinorhizobium meliloti]MDX0524680.1 hypothetical protein [Sinorhizobium medicae]PND18251.1 hypothetical protein CN934_28890 [Ensifer sp. MMN_5]AGA08428.1 hypothetical protein C770_GR4pA116 [Sinorhizobium meliloti GR4]ASQ05925.1 hypothetical protein CDO23_18115 [Sinorhizobium meliloti]MDE3832074.1 hypothetical protein [Sinorhizobium meliloti]